MINSQRGAANAVRELQQEYAGDSRVEFRFHRGAGFRWHLSDNFDIRSDMKEERITVRFPLELRRRLRAAGRRPGARESDIVREAVERHLDAVVPPVSAWQKMKKAGLIGLVHGAPPDLSTNPAHFDAFGGHK